MSVLVDEYTRLIVQGITGREGTFHAKGCADYGTNVVGGVTPGKGGSSARRLAGVSTLCPGGQRKPAPMPR